MSNWKLVASTVMDFEDDLDFPISAMSGVGVPPIELSTTGAPTINGDLYESHSYGARQFSLTGQIVGSSLSDYHSKRQKLMRYLLPRPDTDKGSDAYQLITLRYTGASVSKDINCLYEGGLELSSINGFTEDITLRFLAVDPSWYATSETSTSLTTGPQDLLASAANSPIIYRENGTWYGTTAIANTMGGSYSPHCMFVNDDIFLIGHNRSHFNDDTDLGYLVEYDRGTDTWDHFGAFTSINGDVKAIVWHPSDWLYIFGSFSTGSTTNQGGGFRASIDGVSSGSLGLSGSSNDITCAVLSTEGIIFMGGDIASESDKIATFDPDTLSLSSATTLTCSGFPSIMKVAPNGDIFMTNDASQYSLFRLPAGEFQSGGTWESLVVTTDVIQSMEVASNGDVYYTVKDEGLWKWDGNTATFLTGAVQETRGAIQFDSAGRLFAGYGAIPTLIYNAEPWSYWNGTEVIGGELHTSAINVYDALIDEDDNAYLLVGGLAPSDLLTAATTSITYTGTAPVQPYVTVSRDYDGSGTDALFLTKLMNDTTGAAINCYIKIAEGEDLVIDFRSRERTALFSSNMRQEAAALPYLTTDSDYDSFWLVTDETGSRTNKILLMFEVGGTPTYTATIAYKSAYHSID